MTGAPVRSHTVGRCPIGCAYGGCFLHTGRSSQATLLGRTCETVESLYLSESLVERLRGSKPAADGASTKPMKLPFAG